MRPVFVHVWNPSELVYSGGTPEPATAGPQRAPRSSRAPHGRSRGAYFAEGDASRGCRRGAIVRGERSDDCRRATPRASSHSSRILLIARRRSRCSFLLLRALALAVDAEPSQVSSGKPCSSMYEIVRLAIQITAPGLAAEARRALRHRRPRSRLASPRRAPQPTECDDSAVDRRFRILVPRDAHRIVEEGAISAKISPSCTSAGFVSLPRPCAESLCLVHRLPPRYGASCRRAETIRFPHRARRSGR